jgi:hypothetical protein
MRTALYRHYSDAGVLLYVGISNNQPSRMKAHQKTSPWSKSTTLIKIEYFNTRKEAQAAEVRAIQDEEPLYNVCHQNPNSRGAKFRQLCIAIDLDDLEETIDEYNTTYCNEYREVCLNYILHLSKQLKLNFDTEISPRLTYREIPKCDYSVCGCDDA